MAKTIYNEGRVVGLSAYELFIRNHPDPENAPSEKEWLASTVGCGESLILKCPNITYSGPTSNFNTVYDIPLPENSGLRSTNFIVGSFFLGECEWLEEDSNGAAWAKEVTSYGKLISNTETKHPERDSDSNPETMMTDVPPYDDVSISQTDIDKSEEYMHIVDAVIIQPGHWKAPETERSYYSDLEPDLSKVPVLRLHIYGELRNHACIMLTGFTDSGVLSAVSGLDGSSTSDKPQDGDFLGPQIYPWCTKVLLTTPSFYVIYGDHYLEDNSGWYQNQITGDKYPASIRFRHDKDVHIIQALSLYNKNNMRYQFNAESNSKADSSATLYLNKYGHITWAQLLEAYANNRPIDPMQVKDSEGNIVPLIKGSNHIQVQETENPRSFIISDNVTINPGFGIQVEESPEGTFNIVNTMPSVDTTNFKFLRLQTTNSPGHYVLQTYGTAQFANPQASTNIISWLNNHDASHNPNGEYYNSSGQFGITYGGNYYPNESYAGNPDTDLHDGGGNTQRSKFDITVRIGVDDKADGSIRRVYVSISGGKAYYNNNGKLVTQSALYADNLSINSSIPGSSDSAYWNGCSVSHDASLNSTSNLKIYRMIASSIMGIYFNDLDENIETLSGRNISFRTVYNFMNTHGYHSEAISNVWNMKMTGKAGRTCWPVNCASYYGQNPKHPPYTVYDPLQDRNGIIIYAFQMFDGFNAYFSNLHAYEGGGASNPLHGRNGLNMSSSGYFQ